MTDGTGTPPEAFVVGVDGGGTRTRALITDAAGRALGRAEGPPSLADPARPEEAAGVVAEVAGSAAREAGVELPAAALFAALAGTGRETTRAGVEQALGRLGVAGRVRVDTDARAAFHDAFGDGPGILLVSGTGSMGWGRGEGGREARVGGWGSLLGDEGSGYGIGVEALRRVARSADGRGPGTALAAAILARLGLDGVEALVPWSHGATKAQIAALTPLVVEHGRRGDAVAGEILVAAVEELEGHVLTLLETLGPWKEPPRIALSGGLLEPGGPLRHSTEGFLRRHGVRRVEEEPEPVRGAAALARTMLEEG